MLELSKQEDEGSGSVLLFLLLKNDLNDSSIIKILVD